METKSLRNAIAAASLLVGLAGASSAQADPAEVVLETLGVAATATDVYRLTCPIFTTGVSANVTDLIPVAAPLVSLQIFKPQPLPPGVVSTTDPVDGLQFMLPGPVLGEFPSPTVTLNKGSGQYYLYVDKSAAGAENYRMTVHCNGIFHSTPAWVPALGTPAFRLIQDQ